ncbi:MAG: hypothetical protein ACRCYX_12010, partial [Dermatophilaceae bacterium]
RPEIQRALDTLLSRADPAAQQRMSSRLSPQGPGAAHVEPDSADMGFVPAAAILRWLVRSNDDAVGERPAGRAVDVEDVAEVAAAVRHFENLDHRFGGGFAKAASAEYLAVRVKPLITSVGSGAVGAALLSAASELTYKVGAMAYDSGLHGVASGYFREALELGQAAGDRPLGGKVLAVMSHQANFLGRHAEALDLARAAKLGAASDAPPRANAMYCAMEARACSALGDERAATQAIREAETHFARQGADPGPSWIQYFDVAEFHDELGHCFRDLGRPAEAATNLGIALEASSAAYPRSRTFSRLVLASTHLQRGQVEQAAEVAMETLMVLGSLRSARVRAYVSDVMARFGMFGPCTAADDFMRQARRLLPA